MPCDARSAPRFETRTRVDDVLVETDKGGWVFRPTRPSQPTTDQKAPLGNTAQQIVRLLAFLCARGRVSR